MRYLFSFFRNNGEDGLYLAESADGLRYAPLHDDRPLLTPTVGEAKLMRDPCLAQGPDGRFHLVWTCGWWERSIGYASSTDLVHWSAQRSLPVMEHEPGCRNAWAPELFWDAAARRWWIFWSSTVPGAFAETADSSESGLNHRIYATTTTDFETFTPTRLFLDPGFNCIDATLAATDAGVLLVVKDETLLPEAQKNLRTAAAPSPAGPFSPCSAPITGSWVEGPTVLRLSSGWWIFFDEYTRGRYGAVHSDDLAHWSDASERVAFPVGARHGSVLAVS